MRLIKLIKKVSAIVITLTGILAGFLLIKVRKSGKKGVMIDREKIKEDAKKRIMDTPDSDFLLQHPSVGAAGERGKKRFASRVKRVLHQRGGRGADSGSDEDCGR